MLIHSNYIQPYVLFNAKFNSTPYLNSYNNQIHLPNSMNEVFSPSHHEVVLRPHFKSAIPEIKCWPVNKIFILSYTSCFITIMFVFLIYAYI
jgi:hypothetical protein